MERIANRVLICDTDAFATAIWHERYLGVPSAAVLAVAAGRTYDLYVLTDVDTPFVPDDIRDGERGLSGGFGADDEYAFHATAARWRAMSRCQSRHPATHIAKKTM